MTLEQGPVRVLWIDVARGASMVLVVLWHAALLCAQLTHAEGEARPWIVVGDWLSPMRMPLFFFISGILSTRAIMRPLSTSPARTVGIYTIYVGWTVVFLSRLFLPQARNSSERPPEVWDLVLSAALPTSFWYLWALAAFFVAAWVLQRLLRRHAVWVLVPSVVLTFFADSITASSADVLPQSMDALKLGFCAGNFFWYCAGLWGADVWRQVARRATSTKALVAAAVYGVAVGLSIHTGVFSTVKPLLSAAVLYAIALLTGLVSFTDRLSALLARIGESTLPVYIFHIFLISILSAAVQMSGILELPHNGSSLITWLGPPLLTVLLMASSWQIGRLLQATPLAFTLDPKLVAAGMLMLAPNRRGISRK